MINGFQFCFNFAFNFNLRRYTAAAIFLWPQRAARHPPVQPLLPSPNYDTPVVGRCSLTLSNPC